jgi:tRNA uridine 5-carbamoylmethylation protein Kti12
MKRKKDDAQGLVGFVFIMRGIPGSGKSSMAQHIAARNGSKSIICSADDWFTINGKYKFDSLKLMEAHAWCFDMFKDAIDRRAKTIIVDNTNLVKSWWGKYEAYAKRRGYAVATVTVEEWSVDKCAKRNRHSCPRDRIRGMRRCFER